MHPAGARCEPCIWPIRTVISVGAPLRQLAIAATRGRAQSHRADLQITEGAIHAVRELYCAPARKPISILLARECRQQN
jgi:hypothetical protein